MNTLQSHIQTANYINIKKAYLEDIVLPVFNDIVRAVIPKEKYYRIAGKNICIKFYSEALIKHLSFALLHNEINEIIPAKMIDLTINVWDSVSTSRQFPSPWSNTGYMFDQKINTKNKLESGFMGVYLYGEETLTLYDIKNKTAYFWTNDADNLPYWVAAAPIRTLLHWFLSEINVHLLHGAAVAVGDKAILIAAKGGSGKSTMALSCLLLGMDYLADDYVGVELKDEIAVHSLYNSVKVVTSNISQFEALQKHVWNKEGEKSILFLSLLFPKKIKKSRSLKAIFIPQIKYSKKTVISSASKVQAMIALAPTTLFQLPLAETDKIETIKKIIMGTPCYFLEMSSDSKEAASVVSEFLEKLSC